MKQIFKPEDFKTDYPNLTCNDVANIANNKLKKLMESWPVVYANKTHGGNYEEWFKDPYPGHEVIARLAFIEPIKRECEKHEPDPLNPIIAWHNTQGATVIFCRHCGVSLEATWREKGSV